MAEWELPGKSKKGMARGPERAVLVGLVYGMQDEETTEEYLDELEFLAHTAGAVTVRRFIQKLPNPDQKSYVGKGKLEEIAEFVESHEIDLAIFDDDLSGKQVNHIESVLKVKVVDRSTLILDIFASRAQTAQAQTQVELAQLQYMLPRLRGMWTHLERQRGGIGMRGPGEKEIETDRRIIRDTIALLKKKLERIDRQSATQRKNRGELIRVALIGYTNVGKSTLMNVLSKSDVFAENKLFATLDTTVRKVVFGTMPFLLSDTVGFIRKLPHHLVESFKSTLDEVRESDLLVHVIDVSHPQCEDQIRTVVATIEELGAGGKPTLMAFNKMDQFRERHFDDFLTEGERREIEEELKDRMSRDWPAAAQVFLSARTKENLEELRRQLGELVYMQYKIRYPYQPVAWS